jgi:predicted GNAT family acetyltransferase
MTGLAVYFGEWENFNINSQEESVVRALTDHIVKKRHLIKDIACFRSYGNIIMDQLEMLGFKIKEVEEKSIYKLLAKDFVDFSTGREEQATEEDREALISQERASFENDTSAFITETEINRIIPSQEFIIRKDGKIISKAKIIGLSKHYFQIGGVGTLPEYRGQGLAKQVVSTLCKTYLAQGKSGILFTGDENESAIKVYTTLGFKPFDRYMIAHY